jgi:hypothetical protein
VSHLLGGEKADSVFPEAEGFEGDFGEVQLL